MGKERSTNTDHLNHIEFLASKVGVLSEYMTVMDTDEMICGGHNEYYNVAELFYKISGEIKETIEKIREIRRAA